MARACIVAAVLGSEVAGDLPVHCVHHDVTGSWEFQLTAAGNERLSCGHEHPDSPEKQPPPAMLDTMSTNGLATHKFQLSEPNVATDEHGRKGTWTMIYDEGFEVTVGDNVFFAFSKFAWIDGPKGKTNVSQCDHTQVGWYRNKARTQWGCYVGRKSGSDDDNDVDDDAPPTTTTTTRRASTKLLQAQQLQHMADNLQTDEEDDADAVSLSTPKNYQAWVPAGGKGYQQPMDEAWAQKMADALNFLQLGWSAASYPMFHGKSPQEVNRLAGVRRHRPLPEEQRLAAVSAEGDVSFLSLDSQTKRRMARKRAMKTPSFDWRNKDGKNWVTDVVTQGDCGSCYTISTVHMLTARNKIRQGSPDGPLFSVSFPLYCAEYNQGCDGGYGFLQSKWSEDVGLVPETCLPFSQGGGSCSLAASCDLGSKRYRATNHHYVGGFYGNTDADAIQRELVAGGPLVMSFEPTEDFMYYKSGVYRSGEHKIHQEWEQVDHAVLLVAYGSDQGKDYWTMQNSWGTDWGEDGYFRMARGIDESGCESIVVSADVVEEDSNKVLDDFVRNFQSS